MKKFLAALLALTVLFAFAACNNGKTPAESTAAGSTAQTAEATKAENAEATKHITVAGKTIILKSNNSSDFVEINTNGNNVATNMMIHKFFADDASFKAAVEKGDYESYTLVTSIDVNREIIYSDSDTVNGMTYDEIIARAEKLADYTIIPAE